MVLPFRWLSSEYILSQSSHQISPELLVSSRLDALINYDLENKTELYRTLQVYLEHERNSLQTAKTLFIHRSSLVYRLERIQKITKIDLDNPRNRLLLQICFLLIQEKEPASDWRWLFPIPVFQNKSESTLWAFHRCWFPGNPDFHLHIESIIHFLSVPHFPPMYYDSKPVFV